MENAGRNAASLLLELNPQRRPVAIVCGNGNNGGDGYVIARQLEIAGCPVQVWPLTRDLTGDAAVNFEIVRRSHIPWFADAGIDDASLSRLEQFDGWIVDALFGTGLNGPIHPPTDRVVTAINASPAKVFAVDIPSGLDCDTGQPLGPTIRADHTVTFVAEKAGFTQPGAREWTGEVHVADIGAPRCLLREFGLSR